MHILHVTALVLGEQRVAESSDRSLNLGTLFSGKNKNQPAAGDPGLLTSRAGSENEELAMTYLSFWRILLVCLAVGTASASGQVPRRDVVSLNGQWQVEESVDSAGPPRIYRHAAPVPGLTHSALPAFADVDQFQSRELLSNLVRNGSFAQADYDRLGSKKGISHQQRNYFWYRRTFTAPNARAVALLKIGKAQFGTVVYLNGVRVGEHDPCFTAAYFDVSSTIHWAAVNELVVRIGAHPNVLPANVSEGTDFEKNRWTPGIYDDVSLLAGDNPFINVVQAAPQITQGDVLVQTELHNFSDHPISTTLKQQVFTRQSRTAASSTVIMEVQVSAGATLLVKQTVPIPSAHLWSPEDPFLYTLETATSGDSTSTRFGMREFRFDTATRRAYLNGRPYFLRGSNITLHRFFEDPQVGTLPWDEHWLHRLLVDLPKQLHWNSFRFCIGPVPDRWLEIADENGLLIENEYFVWVGHNWGGYQPSYDPQEMIGEYREWMRDNWNHPSVALWDATNESWLPDFSEKVIPAIRGLDLSNRPWENSYNPPAGGDDPVEDHQYLFYSAAEDTPAQLAASPAFQITDLEAMMGPAPGSATMHTGHANLLNEYGWLWLNRDGSPTLLTTKLYPKLMKGRTDTADSRFAMQAYLLGGETEYWRATRYYAGVLHFVFLTASDPRAFTSDHFLDVKNLTLEPHFERAMEEAFNPLGVYLNFWQPKLPGGEMRDYTVSLVNDEDRLRSGELRLTFRDANGQEAGSENHAFTLLPLGTQTYSFVLRTPSKRGAYTLEAVARAADDTLHPTTSRRDLEVEAK